MGYEVEQKYRVTDPPTVAGRLLELGARRGAEVEQSDIYLAHPCRDFVATREALRVRRDRDRWLVTYKGPRHAGPTKTREEIEVPISAAAVNGADILKIFLSLGFREVAVVNKLRRSFAIEWEGRKMECVLDHVEDLGFFAEVESLAEDASDLAEAQSAVIALSAVLGLRDLEPRSYLSMVLEAKGIGFDQNKPSNSRTG